MQKGIANQSLVALRREPSESSEMVSQLLFGEKFTIFENYKSWLRVICDFDSYEGWLDSKLVETILDEKQNEHIDTKVCNTLFSAKKTNSQYPIRICPGSSIYDLKNDIFSVGSNTYTSVSTPLTQTNDNINEEIIRLAKLYVNSPYLWGGRSPFGIDCSGLVQVVYKILGIDLPRDAGQQVKIGETVDFINLVQSGDLAFFDNDEEIITHVGILVDHGKVIHSSGFVKIDNIDHQGIFNAESQKYSHKLRVIKRVL